MVHYHKYSIVYFVAKYMSYHMKQAVNTRDHAAYTMEQLAADELCTVTGLIAN